jgi:hypothetical protein
METKPKIFISHATADHEIIRIIESKLKEKGLDPYLAERRHIGRPLIEKLRDELEDSSMFILVWTKNVEMNSKSIIAFETGMAWTNRLPIFILKQKAVHIDWFYEQITDYAEFDIDQPEKIGESIDKFDFNEYLNPIEFSFPVVLNKKGNSTNESVFRDDGLFLKRDFNDIIHFTIKNKTKRIIRDVRIDINFPKYLNISFNPGDTGDGVQKNEIFDIKCIDNHRTRLMMPALPSDEPWEFEQRIAVNKEQIKSLPDNQNIVIKIQGGDYPKRVVVYPTNIAETIY